MNELANVAELMGADIEKVRLGIGSDPRIGYHFIYPAGGGTFLVSDGKDLSTPGPMGKVARAMRRRAWLFAVPPPALRLVGALLGRSAEGVRLIESLSLDIAATRSTLAWNPPSTVYEVCRKPWTAISKRESCSPPQALHREVACECSDRRGTPGR
jgi:hypothetical protein